MPTVTALGHRRRLQDWWLNAAVPLWLERGVDWNGAGFFDQLSVSDGRNTADFKRVRVCARQIFVFARLAHEYDNARAADAVAHGLACMLGPMRHPGGGFIQSITLDGAVRSGIRDLYDQAFVLFALAHAYRLTDAQYLHDEAVSLISLLEGSFRHRNIGFVEALPASQPRRQNPHMHLLEACLAWSETGRDGPWRSLARELVALMRDRFWSAADQRLFEYFDDDLNLTEQLHQQVFEPGHHFEWIHLLKQADALGIAATDEHLLNLLSRAAHDIGIAPTTGLPYGTVGRDNGPIDPLCRIWQLSEWLRVAVLYPEFGGPEAIPANLLLTMIDVPQAGLWRERRNAVDGSFVDEPCPASSLYHIMTGCESFVFG